MASRAERVESELVSLADWIERYFASRDLLPPPAIAAGVASAHAALALPADAPAQPAPEGAGGAVRSQKDFERWAAACVNGPEAVRAIEGAYGQGWVDHANAHPTPRAEAASAEAVLEACHAAALRVADGHLDALRWIAAQSCRGDACCASLGACVTERCETCYARAALGLPEKAAEPASPASAVPAWRDSFPPTHYCRECKALWRRWPDGSWSLVTMSSGKCCDNVPMGEQIAPLASEYPTLRVERPTALATPGEVAPGAPNQAGVTAGETALPPTHTPASAEAVRDACVAAVDREAGALEALIDESDDLPRWQAQKMPVVKKLREVASMLRSLPLPASASAEGVADRIFLILGVHRDKMPNEAVESLQAVAHALRAKGAK